MMIGRLLANVLNHIEATQLTYRPLFRIHAVNVKTRSIFNQL
jgi:hypothetical protein